MEKFKLEVKVKYDAAKALKRLNMEDGGRVQQIIDSEVMRMCDPLVPFDTGALKDSAVLNTKIGSGAVIYRTPYARKQYYIPMNHHEGRTDYWFEHMKKQGGVESILNSARKAVGK